MQYHKCTANSESSGFKHIKGHFTQPTENTQKKNANTSTNKLALVKRKM